MTTSEDEFVGREISAGSFSGGAKYTCRHPWPEDCSVQCGGDGIVFVEKSLEEAFEDPIQTAGEVMGIAESTDKSSYRTAFFEAFPRNPNTFIRGEGKTREEAEDAAWTKFQKHSACEHPAFEKRGYNNGAGFCVACGMFSSKHYAPWDKCPGCDHPVYPGSRCYHCRMTQEAEAEDKDGLSELFADDIAEDLACTEQLFGRNVSCPECKTHVSDMRLVSPYEYGINDKDGRRQDMTYQAAFRVAPTGDSFRAPAIHTHPYSHFYRCQCESLRLMTDLLISNDDELHTQQLRVQALVHHWETTANDN